MADEFIQRFLDDPGTQEALFWLRSGAEFRSLGEHGSTEESIALVESAYAAGAVSVVAVEIDDYGADGQNTGKIVVALPAEPELRRGVFAWCGHFAEERGFDADQDEGQTHLFVMFD